MEEQLPASFSHQQNLENAKPSLRLLNKVLFISLQQKKVLKKEEKNDGLPIIFHPFLVSHQDSFEPTLPQPAEVVQSEQVDEHQLETASA